MRVRGAVYQPGVGQPIDHRGGGWRFGTQGLGQLGKSHRGRHCCFGEEYASITVDCDSSDGERELGERSREPMPRVNVGGQFVVAAANILDKGVAEADHPYGTDLFETAHRP